MPTQKKKYKEYPRIFEGWIEGKPQDKRKLLKLGVKGRVKYNKDFKCFEHCKINENIIENLRKEHRPFWSPAFTYESPDGKQEFLNIEI